MRLIRNPLALIGLAAVILIAVLSWRLGPVLADFDPGFVDAYGEFAGRLLESGDPGVTMAWSIPVQEGLETDDVIEFHEEPGGLP